MNGDHWPFVIVLDTHKNFLCYVAVGAAGWCIKVPKIGAIGIHEPSNAK